MQDICALFSHIILIYFLNLHVTSKKNFRQNYKCYYSWYPISKFYLDLKDIQGYPQRMRLKTKQIPVYIKSCALNMGVK